MTEILLFATRTVTQEAAVSTQCDLRHLRAPMAGGPSTPNSPLRVLIDEASTILRSASMGANASLKVRTRQKATAAGHATLVEIAELQIRFFREHPDWTRVASMLVSASGAALPSAAASRLYEAGHKLTAEIHAEVIARGQREGTVRQGDPRALALIFLGMLETFHDLDEAGHPQPPNLPLDEFLDLVRATFRSTK
jgi:hypothetical protein